jgi:DNA/RNA endonuclease YhcR with UshA esterase domain
VLKDEGGNIITASAYQGKNINVKGIIDYFNGTYQIKVFSANDITINE